MGRRTRVNSYVFFAPTECVNEFETVSLKPEFGIRTIFYGNVGGIAIYGDAIWVSVRNGATGKFAIHSIQIVLRICRPQRGDTRIERLLQGKANKEDMSFA